MAYGTYSNTGQSPTYTCLCGSPATKLLYNPRGVSQGIYESTLGLMLCDACDFRWTVMRAAGRVEEFVTDAEKKLEIRAKEEAESAAKMQVFQSVNEWKPAHYPENVQSPEEKEQKKWYARYREYVLGRKNG